MKATSRRAVAAAGRLLQRRSSLSATLIIASLIVITSMTLKGWVSAVALAQDGRRIEVEVGDNFYTPATITARQGDRLIFINRGKQLHGLTLVDQEEVLDEEYLNPGMTFTFVVPTRLKPGTYVLGCNIHVAMKGKLMIKPGS